MKKYQHYDTEPKAFLSEPVIAGKGADAQQFIRGTVNKWVSARRFDDEDDDAYTKRNSDVLNDMQRHRSHLLVSPGFNTSTARMVAVVAEPQPLLGYSWMPVMGNISLTQAKAMAVYFNSTVGRIQLRRVSGRDFAYPVLNPDAWHHILWLDLTLDEDIRILAECYETTRTMLVSQFRDGRTRVRDLWDDAVCDVIDFDRSVVEEMADMLSCDPTVSKELFYEEL